ncbi:MAG: DUF4011 domain-containing protein [Scytonematopsis contorta HA4267-MV1]|jgi:hypothetical protein|nr:DUF4011 domain-containing protein [Scytonematopsis contorta HA4267-MV1]
MSNAVTTGIQSKIQQWKERLADLTKRNRLLYFQKDKQATTEIPIPPSEVFENLVANSESISLTELKADETDALIIKRNLKKLRKDANSILKEKGVNSLFIALGTLKWNSKDKPKEFITSPIILIPIELYKLPRREEYELRPTGETVSINPVLVLKLYDDFGINLPEEIEISENLTYEDVFNSVSQNKDISERIKEGKWNIAEATYLGLFDRTKASMIKDIKYLEEHNDVLVKNPILLGLANDSTAYESSLPEIVEAKDLDVQVNSESVFQVLEADSSQQEVIEAVKAGMSLIVQGPPGTGKSQTIVNIIAELIGQKKKVLVVAEKAVALEVVFDRLKESALEDICLNFSDKNIVNKKNFAKVLDKTKSELERREVEELE